VAANGGVILITSNGGTSWTEAPLDTQVPGYLLNNANVAWASNLIVYACSESTVVGAVRVARSANGGSTWAAANSGLPDISVSKLQVDPRDSTGNTVYAATFAGVYQTTNGGTSWNLFGAGLPDVHVTDMYMPADGSFMRVSTFGRGIWEINLSQPTHFMVTAPGSASGGVPFTFTVTVLDAHGNPVPNYTGTVHFTSSDPAATLPADYTFAAADSGSHTFSGGAALVTLGTQTITATDTLTASLTGFATISVTPGPATHFTVAAAPANTAAGSPVSITVTAFDVFNNTAPGYRGTVHFTSSDIQATLPADYTFVVGDNGAHTFPGVILKTAGNPGITVRDTVTASISGSVTVAVTALSATHYSMTVPPTVTTGTLFTVRLVAQDQFNNTDHGYLGTVHFTSSDTSLSILLPGDYTFTAGVGADNGIHLFSNAFTLQTIGPQSITATDTVTASITATVPTQVVSDQPLAGVARTIRLRSGRIPVVVATFTDADPAAIPGDFSVSINWGDSTPPDTTTAIVTQPGGPGGTFIVTAKHFYPRKGIFAVKVSVKDNVGRSDAGGSLLDINSTASFFPRSFSF
jgi:hypothetical protein